MGCQPYPNTQEPSTSFINSSPSPPRSPAVSTGDGETFDDFFGAFGDPLSAISESGYDGTRPIAYIRVNDPQRYLPRPTHDASGPHSRPASSSPEQPTSGAHPNRVQTDSKSRGQKLITDGDTYHQWATDDERSLNQPPSYPPLTNVDPHRVSHMNSASNLGYHQNSSAQSHMVFENKPIDDGLNSHQTPREIDLEKRDPVTQTSPGVDDITQYTASFFTSISHAQSMNASMMSQRPDLACMNCVPRRFDNGSESQLVAEIAGYTPASTDNTFTPNDGNVTSYPNRPDPGCSSWSQSLPSNCQPSISRPHTLNYDSHMWSHNPLTPVAGSEFQLTPAIVVPAPRRSLQFGAFLTPDPPCQPSNLDLPPRPGTSPPQRLSAPNGQRRLLPNTGRRLSEQTWQAHSFQFDRAHPAASSHYSGNTSHFGDNHTHAPQNHYASRMQPWAQGTIQGGDNFATANYRPAPFQAPNNQPVATDVNKFPSPVQQPLARSLRGSGARKPGRPQGRMLASTALSRETGQQRPMWQRASDSEFMRKRPSVQIQPGPSTAQSKDSKERTDQLQVPVPELSTQEGSLAAGRYSSGNKAATKRRHGQSNPDNTSEAKKRKLAATVPEVTNQQPGQRQQILSGVGNNCVYFDAGIWRGDDIADQGVRHDASATRVQSQGEGEQFVAHSLVASQATGRELAESVATSSEFSQGSRSSGEVVQLAEAASWEPQPQPVGQGQGMGDNTQYINWNSSVNTLLDQTPAFNAAVSESGIPEPYATVLNLLERPIAEELAPAYLWMNGVPNNLEVDQIPVGWWGETPVTA